MRLIWIVRHRRKSTTVDPRNEHYNPCMMHAFFSVVSDFFVHLDWKQHMFWILMSMCDQMGEPICACVNSCANIRDMSRGNENDAFKWMKEWNGAFRLYSSIHALMIWRCVWVVALSAYVNFFLLSGMQWRSGAWENFEISNNNLFKYVEYSLDFES